MEEWIGQHWDRFVTHRAERSFEAEAVTRDRAALAERWADAKRTQGSVMHDVAGVMAVVDALLGALP